ncbi:hypothetical protein [Peribacillus simplex]|uniref:hypothetical protein n=1 Tax=Peribacillus simplex TaxID=1478 RepID=UPI003D29881B
MWIKIAASIGLITIGILIGSITNLIDLGDNPELNEKDNYEVYLRIIKTSFSLPIKMKRDQIREKCPLLIKGESEDGVAKPY